MKNTLLIVVLTIIWGCSNTNTLNSFDKLQVKQEVSMMLIDYHQSINKHGLMAEFNYLDSSANFFWVPPGYASVLTYDSIRTIIEQNAKTVKSIDLQWQSLQIFPLSSKIANYSGIVKSEMIDSTMAKFESHIIESGTVIKRADGWKLLCGQSAILNRK